MKAGQRNAAVRGGPSRTLILVSTALTLLVGGAFVAVPFVVGPLLRARIIEEARSRGVELTFSDVSFFWWSTSLEGARFRLVGVPGIEGESKAVDVTLSHWEPKRISATDVRVNAVGSVADLALALGEWTRAHPKAYEIPVTATHVAVSYRASSSEAPWLSIEDGAFGEGAPGTIRFAAPHATVASVDVGAVNATWTAASAAVFMAFGSNLDEAPLKFVVRYASSPPTATVTLARTPLAKLSGPLGVPLLSPGVVASGTADLTFVNGIETGPVTGSMAAKLEGWVPPHPVELDGFVFGGITTFTSRLEVSKDRKLVRLTDSHVKAGAFMMAGGGTVERHDEGYATIRMEMSGNLPCAAVAESAAQAHVGTFLSKMIGQATRRVVEGSVAVSVKILADSRHLDTATVEPRVGVGCGLVPLFGLDPARLQALPKDLRALANALPLPNVTLAPQSKDASGLKPIPSLPSSIPALPNALPTIPSAFSLPFQVQPPP